MELPINSDRDQLFVKLYTWVEGRVVDSLTLFRNERPVKSLEVDCVQWDYIDADAGEKVVLFLHGQKFVSVDQIGGRDDRPDLRTFL